MPRRIGGDNAVKLGIRLFAGLKCNNPVLPCFGAGKFELDVPDGTTIGELRGILALDPAMPVLCMVNHHHEHEDRVLADNDQVGMFPPIGGG
jgi:molybdopterin synthase sulfur carrier subunit